MKARRRGNRKPGGDRGVARRWGFRSPRCWSKGVARRRGKREPRGGGRDVASRTAHDRGILVVAAWQR